MNDRPVVFRVDGPDRLSKLLERLAEPFPLRTGSVDDETAAYLDTFDWRLFRAGYSLRTCGTEPDTLVVLTDVDGVEQSAPMAVAPRLAEDLPSGPMRDALAAATSVRCLFEVARTHCRRELIDVLDEERKTIARLTLERRECSAENAPTRRLRPVVLVSPVRGYEDECKPLLEFLGESPGVERGSGGLLGDALAALGKKPGVDPSKPRISIAGDMTAAFATRAVLSALVDVLRVNEHGVRESLDIEFVHDFRVAVRRTRSVLGQVQGVLPAGQVERYKREFRWLGSVTGVARDLDVFLYNLAEYSEWLPEDARPVLGPLRSVLETRRATEQSEIVTALKSARYRTLLQSWRAVLDSSGSAAKQVPENARRPVREVVAERIAKRYRGIAKLSANGSGLPAAVVHEVRIQCKKLRYLLELYAGAFETKLLNPAVKALKRLQTSLGDFNDYDVHAQMLMEVAEKWPLVDPPSARDLLSLGRLVGCLESRRDELLGRCAKSLREFCRGDSRARFRALVTKTRRDAEAEA